MDSTWAPGQRLLTAGLVVMVTAVAFEGLAVPTALPATLDDLGGLALYGWAFSGFWLTNLIGITVAGVQADRAGPLPPFLAGVLLFGSGLLIAAVAPDMAWVVAGRAVQGLGAGAIGAITYVAIARGYGPAARPRMIAIISSAWVLPGLVGPALAGYVAQELSWRWIFAGLVPLLPFAALALSGPMRRLRSRGGKHEGNAGSVPDALSLVMGSGAVLVALSIAQPLIAVLLAAAGLLVGRHALARLLPVGTLQARPGPAAAVAALALLSIAFFGAEAFVPLAVASLRGAGTLAGGMALTAAALTWAVGSWIQARLAARGVRARMVAAGFALVLAGIALETAVPLAAVPIWLAPLAWAIAGLGMGLAYSTITLQIIETAPAGAEGAASAAVQLASSLGTAVGTGLAGGIVTLATQAGGLAPGIAVANLAMVGVAGVGLLITRRLPPAATGGHRQLPGPDHGPAL